MAQTNNSYYGSPPTAAVDTEGRYSYTATAGQAIYSAAYTLGFVDVYQNGSRLNPDATVPDFTATDGLTIVLAVGATVGDEISIIAKKNIPVMNAIDTASVVGLLAAKASVGGSAAQNFASSNTDTPSINSGQIGGFKNVAINGEMSIAQVNGLSLVTTGINTDTYVIDQHIVNAAGAAVTAGQSTDVVGLPTGFAYSLKISGAASNTNVVHKHRIEAAFARRLASRTIAVTWYMYQNSGATMAGVTCKAFCPTTTANTFSALTQEGSTVTVSVATSGTISKYTAIIVLGSTNVTRGLEIQIATNAAVLAGVTCYITAYQVEAVSAGATSGSAYEFIEDVFQLERCSGYLIYNPLNIIGTGYTTSATTARILFPTPIRMRFNPTINITGVPNFRFGGADYLASSFTATTLPGGLEVSFIVATAANGNSGTLYSSAGTFTANAQLV